MWRWAGSSNSSLSRTATSGSTPTAPTTNGNPVPEIHWSVGDRALRTIERANEIQRSVLEELGAEIEWVAGPDATGPAYHHMGTTR